MSFSCGPHEQILRGGDINNLPRERNYTRNALAGLVRRGPPRIAPPLGFQAGVLANQQNGLGPVQR
jgi:hypothetical protein